MLLVGSQARVIDNSGAKRIQCIRVIGKKSAGLGDEILGIVSQAQPNSKLPRKTIVRAVVCQTAKKHPRQSGASVKFSTNSVVLIDNNKNPIGTRLSSGLPQELRLKGWMKLLSLATDVF